MMLGPSIVGAVTPFAFGYSLFARTRGSSRRLNYTALALTALELVLVVVWFTAIVIDMTKRS
jgi:hypothetical protein